MPSFYVCNFENIRHDHERLAAKRILTLLRGVNPAADCYLVFSAHLGAEVDCILFSSRRIIIGELKSWDHKVVGSMNGDWHRAFGAHLEVIDSNSSPHEQARKQRSVVTRELASLASRLDIPMPSPLANFVGAGMVQCPRLDLDFEPMGMPWWFAEGLGEFAAMLRRTAEEPGGPLPTTLFDRFLRKAGIIRRAAPRVLDEVVREFAAAEPAPEMRPTAPAGGSRRHRVVIAGAGAGKTTVMARSISDDLNSGSSAGVFAISYTNRARNVLQNRVLPMLSASVREGAARFGTIHQFARALGERTQRKRLLSEQRIARLIRAAAPESAGVQDAPELVSRTVAASNGSSFAWPHPWCARAWEAIRAEAAQSNRTTFALMLLEGIEAATHAELTFDEVYVDEFQDTNGLQYELLRRLAARGVRITVVGDAEQSIYSFAGAIPDALARFEREFHAERKELDRNYRSVQNIVRFANRIRSDTLQQQAHKDFDGIVRIEHRAGRLQIAQDIAEEIQQRCSESAANDRASTYSDFAILARTEADLKHVERTLAQAKIPFVTKAKADFASRPRMQALLNLLILSARPTDPLAICDALDGLQLGTQSGEVDASRRQAGAATIDELLTRCSANTATAVRELLAGTAPNGDPLPSLIERLFDSLIMPRLNTFERVPDSLNPMMRDVKALTRLAATLQIGPAEFADLVIRDGAIDRAARDGVRLSTVHEAKGDEWRTVFIVNAGDKAFPLPHATDLAEERRVFYVAATRPEVELVLWVPQPDGLCQWAVEPTPGA